MQQYFLIRLVDDVIISQRAASTSGHIGLNHLPGSTFLGAVAQQLYAKLPLDEQLTIFHSGKVRFATALPVTTDGKPSYPVPICWHYQKDEKKDERSITNHQHYRHPDGQPVQYRDEFFIFDKKHFFKPESQYRLRTAIDPKTGRTVDGALFGYAALPKGALFWGKLEADDGCISQQRFDQIVDTLKQGVRLGSSRSAEYGRVAIELLDKTKADKLALPIPQPAQTVMLWLLADAALQDEYGQTTLQPSATAVDLPTHFSLDFSKTYVRTTRYAPYNGHRQRRELERNVLLAGSVLHFSSDTAPASADDLLKIQTQGIGLYRQNGLGWVWVNPNCLAKTKPTFSRTNELSLLSSRPNLPPEPSDNPLYNYLIARKNRVSNSRKIEKKAREWANELAGVNEQEEANIKKPKNKDKKTSLYEIARALEPFLTCVGPNRHQWSRVMQAAQKIIQKQETVVVLRSTLFEGKHAICKTGDSQWSKRVYLGRDSKIDSFRAWFKEKLDEPGVTPELVARFARLAMDVAEREGCKMAMGDE